MGREGRGGFLRFFRRRRAEELADIEAEITDFGEALARFQYVPRGDEADGPVLADVQRALDAYDRAKRDFAGDRDREDAADVLRALDDGRYALACAAARSEGRALPERRLPCFFDPRHGPSTAEVDWAPPGGAARTIPVCAADAVRIKEGQPPIATGSTPRRAGAPAPRPAPGPGPAAPASGGPGRTSAGPTPKWLLYKEWPPDTPDTRRAGGSGTRDVELLRTDSAEPVLLVLRMFRDGAGQAYLDGASGRRALIERMAERVVTPVPADGARHVRVRVESSGSWRLWLQSPDRVRVVERSLQATGSYVFRYEGGPGELRFSHQGGGRFAVEALGEDLSSTARLLSGKGTSDVQGVLPGPGLYQVQSYAPWQLFLIPTMAPSS
ncbi:hypothetical protein ACIPIC_09665 [Streptomyces collinus]|uniref:hypothetical protein n=1 Tax=Streptomyces collinus TaxID=42684 RepID=UPI00381F5957